MQLNKHLHAQGFGHVRIRLRSIPRYGVGNASYCSFLIELTVRNSKKFILTMCAGRLEAYFFTDVDGWTPVRQKINFCCIT
jgi:hypothetical protein